MRYLFVIIFLMLSCAVTHADPITINADKVIINTGRTLEADAGVTKTDGEATFTPMVTTVPINSLDNDEIFGWSGGVKLTGSNDFKIYVATVEQWSINEDGIIPTQADTETIGAPDNHISDIYSAEWRTFDTSESDYGTISLADSVYSFLNGTGLNASVIAKATTLSAGTTTASSPISSMSQTWNNAAVTFKGSTMAITSTASGNNSVFTEYSLGGTVKHKVNKNGVIYAAGGINGGTTDFTEVNIGVDYGGLAPIVTIGGSAAEGISMRSGSKLAWTSDSNSSLFVYRDTFLNRFAADHIAQFDSTTAQQFSVANTYTSSTNYEMGTLRWTSGVLEIGTTKGSSGSTRNVGFIVGNTREWDLTSSTFQPVNDDSEDIGSPSKRLARLYSDEIFGRILAESFSLKDADSGDFGYIELFSGNYNLYDAETNLAGMTLDNLQVTSILTSSMRAATLETASTSYDVVDSDYLILCDSSVNDVIVNLPAALDNAGRILVIKIISGGTGVVYLNPNGVENIENNSPNYSLGGMEGDAATIQCDGNAWWITGRVIN